MYAGEMLSKMDDKQGGGHKKRMLQTAGASAEKDPQAEHCKEYRKALDRLHKRVDSTRQIFDNFDELLSNQRFEQFKNLEKQREEDEENFKKDKLRAESESKETGKFIAKLEARLKGETDKAIKAKIEAELKKKRGVVDDLKKRMEDFDKRAQEMIGKKKAEEEARRAKAEEETRAKMEKAEQAAVSKRKRETDTATRTMKQAELIAKNLKAQYETAKKQRDSQSD
jgi:hypothetical protein